LTYLPPGMHFQTPLPTGGWGLVQPGATGLGMPPGYQGGADVFSAWEPWFVEDYRLPDPRKLDKGLVFPYSDLQRLDLTSKATLEASQIGFQYQIWAGVLGGAGVGSITVTRLTLRITYEIAKRNMVVDAGLPQTVTGPAPATVSLEATLTGNTDGIKTYEWYQLDGPNFDAVIATDDALATDVEFPYYEAGDYTFEIYCTIQHVTADTIFETSDTVVITMPLPKAPRVTDGTVRVGEV